MMLDNFLLKRMLEFAAKRGLTALGVVLISKGWATEGDWAALVVALSPIVVDLLWSLYDKAKARKREAIASEMQGRVTPEAVTAELNARGGVLKAPI